MVALPPHPAISVTDDDDDSGDLHPHLSVIFVSNAAGYSPLFVSGQALLAAAASPRLGDGHDEPDASPSRPARLPTTSSTPDTELTTTFALILHPSHPSAGPGGKMPAVLRKKRKVKPAHPAPTAEGQLDATRSQAADGDRDFASVRSKSSIFPRLGNRLARLRRSTTFSTSLASSASSSFVSSGFDTLPSPTSTRASSVAASTGSLREWPKHRLPDDPVPFLSLEDDEDEEPASVASLRSHGPSFVISGTIPRLDRPSSYRVHSIRAARRFATDAQYCSPSPIPPPTCPLPPLPADALAPSATAVSTSQEDELSLISSYVADSSNGSPPSSPSLLTAFAASSDDGTVTSETTLYDHSFQAREGFKSRDSAGWSDGDGFLTDSADLTDFSAHLDAFPLPPLR